MSGMIQILLDKLGDEVIDYGPVFEHRPNSYWDITPTQAKCLIRPRTTAEVSKALSICHKFDQPVVTQGGLTGCVAGAATNLDEVILSLERMTEIEAIDEAGNTATVQAGAILQVVQETLADKDLLFPLDLGARGSCTLGGNVATNAGGINVLRYGMMRNLVLGLEVVLADGTILSSMNQMLKNNAGYDIKQLFIGSEGTLGVITRMVLKIFPKPTTCHAALVALNSFDQVISLLKTLQRDLAGTLSAYEVMWGDYFHAVTEPGWHRAPMDRNYSFYVMIEANGASPEHDGEQFTRVLEKAFEAGQIIDAVMPKSENERTALWDIRENFEAILQPKPVYLYDISLPIKDMPAYINEVKTRLQQRWPDSHCYVLGHVADGNLHLFIQPGDIVDQSHASRFSKACDQDVYDPLQSYGGSVSAEHGIGLEKKAWLKSSRSEAEINVMRILKQSLDPKNLLNPGKIFS